MHSNILISTPSLSSLPHPLPQFHDTTEEQLNELDFFFLHFGEEFSAFSGKDLERQRDFVVKCIKDIRGRYSQEETVRGLGGCEVGMYYVSGVQVLVETSCVCSYWISRRDT